MTDGVAQDQIVAFVDRILRMKEEGATRAEIRAVYSTSNLTGEQKTNVGLRVSFQWQARQQWSVYFAAFRGVGLLKIGISKNVDQRMKTLALLRRDKPDVLLTFPGVFALEGWYHAAFSPWRVAGEWFSLNEMTLAMVEALRVSGPAVAVEIV